MRDKEEILRDYRRDWWTRIQIILQLIILIAVAVLLLSGCAPGQHHGHIYIHDPNHVEAIFDRPMTMSVESGGVKVEASSQKPGFFEDILKFLLLTPR